MKLHLPKMLTAAILAAFTVLAANTTAQAETTAPEYSGLILTWNNVINGKDTDLAFGNYRVTDYDPTTGQFTDKNDQRAGWTNPAQGLIATNNTAVHNTLRFAADTYGQDKKNPVFTFDPLVLAGIIVDRGATGYSIASKNGGARNIYLGNNNTTVAYSTINEDFTITKNSGTTDSKIYLRGTQVIEVASEKTYTLTSRDGIDISGALTVQGGGTLKFDGAATLGCTIVNNNSTVTFTGAVTLTESLAGFESSGTYVDYKDETADNGYAGALTYTLVKGGTYTLPAQVTWNGQTKDVVNGTVTIGGDVDKTTYHLVTSGSNLNLADELSHNNQLHTVSMATGTTLNVDTNFAGTVGGTGTAAVTIASGKVLSGAVTGVALSGAGTYALSSGASALATGVTLASDWTGTVRVSSTSEVAKLEADKLVNADGTSWIEFYGFKGYTVTWAAGTFGNMTQNVILTKTGDTPAWEFSAFASSLNTMVATGTWKGDGTFKTSGGNGNQSQGVEYQGNISEWTGAFEANAPGKRVVTFSNNANLVNASFKKAGTGAFELVAATNVTFNNELLADKLTINADKSATLKGAASLGGLVCTGSLAVDAGEKTVSVSGNSNTLGHAIELKSGTLNLSGNYNVSTLPVVGTETIEGGAGIASGSGFIHSEGNITVVDMTSGNGTLNIVDGTVFTHTAGNLQVSQDTGIATIASTNYSALWVKSVGDVSYTAAQTIAGEVSVGTVHLDVQGGVITMDQADAAVALVISEGISGTVKATAATTLNSVTGLGEGQTLTITGNAPVTFGSAVTGSTVSVDGGTLNLGNRIHNLTELSVVNGTVTAVGVDNGNGCVSGTISIGADGVFQTSGHHDVFGYNNNATDKIVMGGTSGHMASLQLTPDGTGVTTMTTDIEMNGYAAITTKNGFNTYNGTITATGVENTIDQVYLRNNVTITVTGEGDVLTIGKLQRTSQFNGTITKEGEGTLVFNGAENYLDQAITVNGGTLALDGTFSIGAIAGTENASYAGGAVADNGFKTSSTTRTVFTKGDGADVTVGQDAHFMVGEEEVELLDNGTATTAATTDYAAFYVRHESEKVSKAFEEQHQPTSFHLSENTGLVVDQDVTAAVRGAGASSEVTIEADQTLTGTAQNVTLAGSGTYALDNATVALGSGVALGGEWAGIVSVSGVTFSGNFGTVCGNLANDDSWIKLKDTKGYLNNSGNKTFTYGTNLILSRGEDGWAYAQNDGNNNSVLVFTGTIVGDGNLGRSEGKGSTYTYEFTGDISGWTGQFISRNMDKNSTTFKLSGEHEGDMEVWATLVNKGTDFYVAVNTDATFNADVEATKVTVADGKTATFLGETTIGTIEGPGKVVVGGGTLTVTGSVAEGVQIEAENGATIAGDGIDTTQVGIAVDATATFEDGILQENGIIFSEGAQVTNQGDAAAVYGADKATMTVKAETLSHFGEGEAVVANKVVVDEIVNWSGSKLTLTNAESMELKSMTISPTSTVEMLYTDETAAVEGTVTITESLVAGGGTLLANLTLVGHEGDDLLSWNLNGQQMTLGSTLTLDTETGLIQLDDDTMRQIAALTLGENWELVVNGGTNLQYDGSEWFDGVFSRTYTNADGDLAQLGGDYKVRVLDNGNFGVVKYLDVPEPTTGTLSLLALMALAARRRRH